MNNEYKFGKIQAYTYKEGNITGCQCPHLKKFIEN